MNPKDKYTREQLQYIALQAKITLVKRYAKEKDILNWGKILFPHKFELPFCLPLHGYFCEVRKDPFTDTEAPRGHSKTTIKCFLIPIFQSIEETGEFKHYLNVQATEKKSMSVNGAIKKEIEENELLRIIYGDLMGDKWTEGQFVLKDKKTGKETIFTGIGAGQSIRGLNYRNIRPDYCIIDDLYDEQDINNHDSTESKNSWFWGSLYKAMSHGKTCIHLQGTAINKNDLYEKLKKSENVKAKTFKAILDESTQEVLWPECHSYESLMRDKELMGSHIFQREMQNERRDDATSIVKTHWIRYYKPADIKFDSHFVLSEVLLCCDPSIGEKVKSDFTGIALIYKCRYTDSEGSVYLIANVWNEKLSLDGRVRLLQSIGDSQPSTLKITSAPIESIAGFKDFRSEVQRRTNLPVKEIDFVKDKISTLESKSHFFENGKVLINENIDHKLIEILAYQLTTNYPDHDDMRDAVLLGLEESSGAWSWI